MLLRIWLLDELALFVFIAKHVVMARNRWWILTSQLWAELNLSLALTSTHLDTSFLIPLWREIVLAWFRTLLSYFLNFEILRLSESINVGCKIVGWPDQWYTEFIQTMLLYGFHVLHIDANLVKSRAFVGWVDTRTRSDLLALCLSTTFAHGSLSEWAKCTVSGLHFVLFVPDIRAWANTLLVLLDCEISLGTGHEHL